MKVQELISAISEAEEKLGDARSELHGYLKPIIKELGEELWGTIISTHSYKDYLEVMTEWSCRNCLQHSNYKIPHSVLRKADQIQAAKEWKIEQDQKDEAQKRAQMEAEFNRLKAQLNK